MSAPQRETLRREKGVQAILDDLHKQMTAAKESTLPQSRTHKAVDLCAQPLEGAGRLRPARQGARGAVH